MKKISCHIKWDYREKIFNIRWDHKKTHHVTQDEIIKKYHVKRLAETFGTLYTSVDLQFLFVLYWVYLGWDWE